MDDLAPLRRESAGEGPRPAGRRGPTLSARDGPPTRIGWLPPGSGEGSPFGAAGVPASGHADFEANLSGQDEVIPIAPGAGNALPIRVGDRRPGPPRPALSPSPRRQGTVR